MSEVVVGERVSYNDMSWNITKCIKENIPCVLALGGVGSVTNVAINGYCKTIKNELIRNEDIPAEIRKKIRVFGSAYKFDAEAATKLSRCGLFAKYKRAINAENLQAEDLNPKYIESLYNQVMASRIVAADGKTLLSMQEAAKNVRLMTIFAHCHGSYVALKLAETLEKNLIKLSYTESERKVILGQMLVVSEAPASPLGVSKAREYAFSSAQDKFIDNHGNLFHQYIKQAVEKNKKIPLSFFEGKKGNLFLYNRKMQDTKISDAIADEHNFIGFNLPQQTDEANLAHIFCKNILSNGVINSFAQADGFVPLPSTEELACGQDKVLREKLAKIKSSGNAFYNQIIAWSKVCFGKGGQGR